MDLVAVEAPSSRVAAAGEALEFLDAALGVVIGKRLKIVANQLIQTLAQGFRPLSRASNDLLVDGERNIH